MGTRKQFYYHSEDSMESCDAVQSSVLQSDPKQFNLDIKVLLSVFELPGFTID